MTPYQIFLSDTLGHPSSLPDQLFIQKGFDFLLTIGGYLVDRESEFDDFNALLVEIGESEFVIQEHSTESGRSTPFERTFSVPAKYKDFEKEIETYSVFGPQVASWYVSGKSQDWGIYLAELPSINIIGCRPYLADKFRQVFKISNSGYSELRDFIRREFRKEEIIEQFETNYRLNGA